MSASQGPAAAIIPVRIGSQRLPGKAMLAETGRPLFLHTWEQAIAADCFATVVVATDSDEVADAAATAGATVVRTSVHPRTGSERCAEAIPQLPETLEFFVNIQGDWPEVEPTDLASLVECLRSGGAPTATLAAALNEPERIADENVVKVVRGLSGDALYFSRAQIPHRRRSGSTGSGSTSAGSGSTSASALRHIGVYGFDRATLLRVPSLPSSGLDEIESLEQLRFLENGIRMRVLDATGTPWGIESRPDYDAFVARRRRQSAERGDRT